MFRRRKFAIFGCMLVVKRHAPPIAKGGGWVEEEVEVLKLISSSSSAEFYIKFLHIVNWPLTKTLHRTMDCARVCFFFLVTITFEWILIHFFGPKKGLICVFTLILKSGEDQASSPAGCFFRQIPYKSVRWPRIDISYNSIAWDLLLYSMSKCKNLLFNDKLSIHGMSNGHASNSIRNEIFSSKT